MASRQIKEIKDPDKGQPAVGKNSEPAVQKVDLVSIRVMMDYPEPTALATILKNVSAWSGEAFAMDPSINVKVQIFAPHLLAGDEAYRLFLNSLSIVGLRAVKVGPVTKVVPIQTIISA